MRRRDDFMVRLVVRQIANAGGKGLAPEALFPPILYLNVLGWLFNQVKAKAVERARDAGLVGQTPDNWWHVTYDGLDWLARQS